MARKYDHEYKVQEVKLAKENRYLKEENEFLEEDSKNQRMIVLALKTEDGRITGKIAFYCRMLGISRQDFYKCFVNKNRPWKYQDLADVMKEIVSEYECESMWVRMNTELL